MNPRTVEASGPSVAKTPARQIQEKSVLPAVEEADLIRQALKQSHGRVGLAAEILGLSRATFWRKRKHKHYGI